MATATDIVVKVIDETRAGLASIKSGLDGLKNSSDSFNNSLKTIVASYATIETTKAFVSLINQVQETEAKLKLVTKGQEQFNDAYQTVFEISQRTRQPIKEVTDLYSKLVRASDDLGISAKEAAKVTEVFNIALQRSGASGPSAAGAITQFAQALQSGKFQGDEFKTITETIPEVLTLISKATGIARTELKKYASDGLLTGEIAALALLQAHGKLEVGQKTLAQSFTQLQNKLRDNVKSFLDSTDAGNSFISIIDKITANMDDLVPVVQVFGIALAALAVYIAPVAAGIAAATVGIVLFAKELAPLARLILSIVVPPIQFLIETLAGVAAGVSAIVSGNFKGVFSEMGKAVDGVAKMFGGADKAGQGLSQTTADLVVNGDEQTAAAERMKAAMEKGRLEALKGRDAYANLVTQLKYNTAASEEDAGTKKYQTELYKGFEAKAKDLKIAVGELSDEQKTAIEKEIGGLIKSKLANEDATKAREKLYNDSVSYLKKYGEDYDKFTSANVTATESFESAKAKLNAEYTIANEHASKNDKAALTQIDEDFRKGILLLQLKGITELAKDYKKYSDDAKTDSQKLADELTKIDEARRIAGVEGESKYQEALQGLRDKFAAKYKSLVESSANFGLTREQELQQELAKLDAEAKAVGYTRQDEYEKQRQAVIFKGYEDIYKRGQKFIEDNLSNEALYNKNIAELELARAASSQANQKFVNAALLAENKAYIDKTVATYPELYKAYSDNLMKMLGVSNENVGKMKEVFRLFGYDVDAILKDLFVQGLRYVLGFTNASNQNINSVQGVMTQIFGSGGTASNTISQFATSGTSVFGSFINGAGNLFRGFGTTVSGIFTGISGFISGIFAPGGSLSNSILSAASGTTSVFQSIANSAGSIFNNMSSSLGNIFRTLGSNMTSVFGSIANYLNTTVLSTLTSIISGAYSAVSALASVAAGKAVSAASSAWSSIVSVGSAIFSFFSDQRMKENLQFKQQLGNGLNLYDFNYKSKYNLGTDTKTGVIAQEVQERYPQAVSTNRNGMLMVDYSKLNIPPNLLKLAKGGIVDRPTMLGTRSLAGEAGPEAVLPLSRGNNGELGVNVAGMGAVNINFTINAVDARGIDQLLVERQTLITNIVRRAVNSRSGVMI